MNDKFIYQTKDCRDVVIGDIIFTDVDENGLPEEKYIVLDNHFNNYEGKTEMKVISIDDGYIFNLEFNHNLYHCFIYFLGTIKDNLSTAKLLKNVSRFYYWMGISYQDIRLLIDLNTGSIEKLNNKNNKWEEYFSEEENDTYTIIKVDNIYFKINYNNLSVKIKKENSKRYSKFDNYLLAFEEDYVFNDKNELKMIYRNNEK